MEKWKKIRKHTGFRNMNKCEEGATTEQSFSASISDGAGLRNALKRKCKCVYVYVLGNLDRRESKNLYQ